MKPFIGVDVTDDPESLVFNGEEFIVAKPTQALQSALETATGESTELLEKSQLPLLLRIAECGFGIAGLLLVSGLLRAWDDTISLAQLYANAPWLFWLCGSFLLSWLVLFLWSSHKTKTVLTSEESAMTMSKWDQTANSIYTELGVPSDAAQVDLLSLTYTVKDGKTVEKKSLLTSPYENFEYRAFADEKYVYLVDLDGKYRFDRAEMTEIETVNKRIQVSSWNKDEKPNKGIYKPYKLYVDDEDNVHMKTYYILHLNHGGEEWGIYFPCYELPTFEALTGLTAQ